MATVYVSGIIDAPADEVWAYARDYNGHDEWHPLIAESTIEDGLASDTVGCVRNFTLTNGGHLRERLIEFSDRQRSFTYEIIVSPMPIANYVATFHVMPVTESGQSFVEWYANFDVSPEDEPTIREQVGRNTFAAGIAALEKAVHARRT
ncbi:SRPBCC family protein [Acuticoccus sp. M5D2P5]|uniref:SRPBCC family protein n=1 Tax=Acuticoccus kalidii TaxID=2910977 RepID=UPI001F24FC52|nr:SRPBCC family protein [Acuticoccus kalidii]MCF3934864.1 SRPBCC family protein [Acuticoccus kalidii]